MARPITHSDSSLAIAVQNGDMQSLTLLIHKYENPLTRYVNYLGVIDDASDVVQDTFIKMYQNINGYDVKRKFSTWIYRIAHNTAISHLRKQKFSIPWEEYLDSFISIAPTDHIDADLQTEQVQKCLDQLPLHYRSVLALYYLEDKSYEEIMDILRLPHGTVAARINRAKKQMRELCQKK